MSWISLARKPVNFSLPQNRGQPLTPKHYLATARQLEARNSSEAAGRDNNRMVSMISPPSSASIFLVGAQVRAKRQLSGWQRAVGARL